MDNIFKITIGETEHELTIRDPNGEDYNEAEIVKKRTFFDALKRGLPTMVELDQLLKQRNIWDEEKEKEVENIHRQIAEKEYQLTKGNIKVDKGKKVALEIKKLRQDIKDILSERIDHYNDSAEGHAGNMYFNCLVSRCLVYNNTYKPYFPTLEEYMKNSGSEVCIWAANYLGGMVYNIGSNAEKDNIENDFLLRFNLVNDDLQLINSSKQLIDEDGDLINEFGYKIDKDGNYIDILGHARDKNGRPMVDAKPFLDKFGKVIVEKSVQTEENLPVSGEVS